MSKNQDNFGTINLIPIKKSDDESNEFYDSENDKSPKIASSLKKENSKQFSNQSNKRQLNFNKHVRISSASIDNNNIISNENYSRNNKLLINKENSEDDLDIKSLYQNCFEGENTIENSNKIVNCSILIYGAKASLEEIEYTFCKSCDSNLINPICIECINNCHKGHNIKKNFMKGHIQCFCGEHLHKIENINNFNDNIQCNFSEWSEVSNINVYYTDNRGLPLCIFCHNFCSKNKDEDVLISNDENNNNKIPNCSCQNELVHGENRLLLEKINEIPFNNYEIISDFHPIQFLNLIFKSPNSFNRTYMEFNKMMVFYKDSTGFLSNLSKYIFSNSNFTDTSAFFALKIFENFVNYNKQTGLRYYCEEIESFFNFNTIKNFMGEIGSKTKDNLSYWALRQKTVHLFQKIYIGNKTQLMGKYKIYDIENFHTLQRIVLYQNNNNIFNESVDIINFFLERIKDITSFGFNHLEAYNYINEIYSVFKKLAEFNLISNGNMMRICLNVINLLSIFSTMRNLYFKNGNKNKNFLNVNNINNVIIIDDNTINNNDILWLNESKFFLTLIKMLHYFIYIYNDRLIENILKNKEKYPTISSINNETVLFIFNKTESGRLISKITIQILNILREHYKKQQMDKNYIKIMKNGMKILDFFLSSSDSYLMQLNKFFVNGKEYMNILDVNEINNKWYKICCEQKNLIEEKYKDYFSFKIGFDDVVDIVDNSLNTINTNENVNDNKKINDININNESNINENNNNNINDNDNFPLELKIGILKSQFFYTIAKFFNVLTYEISSSNRNLKQYYSTFDKIFSFFLNFINNSSDNSIIILSHYIFISLTKAPIDYGLKIFGLFFKCITIIQIKEKILTFNKHIIKNLYQYLMFLNKKKYKEINKCLYLFLKCLDVFVLETLTINVEITVFKCKKILQNLNEKFKIVHKFFNKEDDNKSIHNSNINDNNEDENIINTKSHKFKIDNKNYNKINFEKKILSKIFYIFIKLTNNLFDFEINEDRLTLVNSFFKPSTIITFLKSNEIYIRIRTELLRFLRKFYIDLKFNESNKSLYISSFVSNEDKLSFLKENEFLTNFDYPTKYISFLQDLYNSDVNKIPFPIANNNNNQNENVAQSNIINNAKTHNNYFTKYFEKLNFDDFNDEIHEDIKTNLDYRMYDVLIYEIKNISIILKSIKTYGEITDYFQNGILIPLIYFVKKCFYVTHYFTGKEMLDLYNLIIMGISIKKFISGFNLDFWSDEEILIEERNKEIQEKLEYTQEYVKNYVMINGEFCMAKEEIEEGLRDCRYMEDYKFNSFDYTVLYLIAEKHLFNIIKPFPPTKTSSKFSDAGDILNAKYIKKFEKNYFNVEDIDIIEKKSKKEREKIFTKEMEIQRRFIRIYTLYKCSKESITDDTNSSLFNALPEICLEFETNYHNLLTKILIYNGENKNKNQQFSKISYFLLFKLLSLQTTETQQDVIELLGGNDSDNLGFMINFKEELIKRIILLFLEFLNPCDKLISLNYIFAYNLIKVFKFLCEEHNNFFQGHLIKSISFDYFLYVPILFKSLKQENSNNNNNNNSHNNSMNYNNNANNDSSNINNSLILNDINVDEKSVLGEKNTIKFFDFFLHILNKIILISKWTDLNNEDDNQNEYLFDLFSAILELEIEIIQGNKPEYLIYIGYPEKNIDNEDEEEGNENENKENNDNKDKNKESESEDSLEKDLLFENEEEDSKFTFQIFVEEVIDLIFNDNVSLELIFQIRNQLMQFFTAILEEKNCNEEVQKFLIKNLNIHKVFNSISSILKCYYIDNSDYNVNNNFNNNYNNILSTAINIDEINIDNNNLNSNNNLIDINNNNNINLVTQQTQEKSGKTMIFTSHKRLQLDYSNLTKIKKVHFNHKVYSYFKHEYFHNKEFSNSNEFQLANIFYKYIKLISVQGKNEESDDLINKVNNMTETEALKKFAKSYKLLNSKKNKNLEIGNLLTENIKKFDNSFIEKFYVVKFFEIITETVEVRTEDFTNQTVIFTKLPDIQYLSNDTKFEFEKNVKRTNETSKKNDLVGHVDLFIKEINFNKKITSKFNLFFGKINYDYIQWFSYFYALAINLFMIFTLKGDNRIMPPDEQTIRERREAPTIIKDLIQKSLNNWSDDYNKLVYIFVVINLIFIISWIYFRMPLYYRLDKIIYMEENNISDKNKLTLFDKIKIILIKSIWDRDYISTLIFEFFISLIGAIMKRGEIIYPFLLLAILDLNLDLKNIIISVKEKYKELGLTFVLMVLIMYVFSNVAFFFFDDDYAAELEYKDDNVCSSLMFCFLTALDSGLRARGGLGDSGERISFARYPGHYAGRIITDDLFFFIVIIIMIDLVFGIVIEAFNHLGVKELKQKNDVTNHCFICHINKATVEKNRQNFNEHRKKTHYLWNYVDYMISLKFSDIHDLNAINSYAREKLDNKDISWLPTYKDYSSGDEKRKNDENEDEFEIADENINKYQVKEV